MATAPIDACRRQMAVALAVIAAGHDLTNKLKRPVIAAPTEGDRFDLGHGALLDNTIFLSPVGTGGVVQE